MGDLGRPVHPSCHQQGHGVQREPARVSWGWAAPGCQTQTHDPVPICPRPTSCFPQGPCTAWKLGALHVTDEADTSGPAPLPLSVSSLVVVSSGRWTLRDKRSCPWRRTAPGATTVIFHPPRTQRFFKGGRYLPRVSVLQACLEQIIRKQGFPSLRPVLRRRLSSVSLPSGQSGCWRKGASLTNAGG